MSKTLTGIKDIDLKILLPLNDTDLSQMCYVNRYINKLCNDEHFWRERTINFFIKAENVFTNIEQLDKFRKNKKWKKYYKFLMKIVISYIKYDVHDFDIADTEDEEMIFQTFIDNGNTVKELLKNKDYKGVDEFLNTHYVYSTGSGDIFMESSKEGLEYFLSRSIIDYRIIPDLHTFYRVFAEHNDNYKIFLKYMDINDVLTGILSYRVMDETLFEKISYILQQPGIKLETVLSLIEDMRLQARSTDLLITKARELSKTVIK